MTISFRYGEKFATTPSITLCRIFETKDEAELEDLHNDEHHNLSFSSADGVNITSRMTWCASCIK